ncbi:MAG TPA: hypothetical protein VNS34_21420 [Rhizobiaceae bacterium]|nr:hypothetical protein [Rhizobiaceae bacterium]
MALSGISRTGVFRPQELAFLQEIFDGCGLKPIDREAADVVAKRLITAYESGMRDRDLLRLTAIGAHSTATGVGRI